MHRHHIPIPQDLKAVARELGENMSDEELQEMIREADKAPVAAVVSPRFLRLSGYRWVISPDVSGL